MGNPFMVTPGGLELYGYQYSAGAFFCLSGLLAKGYVCERVEVFLDLKAVVFFLRRMEPK